MAAEDQLGPKQNSFAGTDTLPSNLQSLGSADLASPDVTSPQHPKVHQTVSIYSFPITPLNLRISCAVLWGIEGREGYSCRTSDELIVRWTTDLLVKAVARRVSVKAER